MLYRPYIFATASSKPMQVLGLDDEDDDDEDGEYGIVNRL